MNEDVVFAALEAELEAILTKHAAAWGVNVGKSYGRGSAKGGWSTKFRSAGVENPKPVSKALPNLPGAKLPAVKNQPMPKQVAEANNQVTLRRGLSNIELPEPK